MKIKTDALLERIQNSFVTKVVLCLLLVFSQWIPFPADTGTMRAHFFAYSFSFLLLFSFVRDIWYILLPWRKLRTREEEIICGKNMESGLALPYVYSSLGRDVEHELNRLYDRKEMLDRSMEQSQYLALLHQINPHFLYNTLDSIRGEALMANEVKIADMIEALSTYFAYPISNLDQLATLSEELSHVKDYFYIQKYRFEERIDLEIVNTGNINTQELYIPRLMLQPVVENAISHGIGNRQISGTITIELMRTKDNLIINVMDDGVGIEETALAQLNDRLKKPFESGAQERSRRGGIALCNVNSRIKLLFGDDFGLRIYSVIGKGTTARFLLPAVLREDINEKRILESR